MRHRLPVLVSALMLAACAAPAVDKYAGSRPEMPAGARTALAGVDWSTAQTVTVTLDAYRFDPDSLRFIAGQPYRLVLRNVGTGDHSFAAGRFFAAIAIHEVSRARAENAGGLVSLIVPPGDTRTVEFVPLTPGVYPLECDRPLHAGLGMLGEITISAR